MEREFTLTVMTLFSSVALFMIALSTTVTAWKFRTVMSRLDGSAASQRLIVWGITLMSVGWAMMTAGVIPSGVAWFGPGERTVLAMLGLGITAGGKVTLMLGSWLFDDDVKRGLLGY